MTTKKTCTVPGCERTLVGRGYCSMHWQRVKKTGDPGGTKPQKQKLGRNPDGTVKECIVSFCKQPQHAKRMCNRHHHMRSTFNLGVGVVERFESNAVCSIPSCRSTYLLRIDHDHKCCPRGGSCGRCVRGWLCHNCNSALGFVQDSEVKLEDLKTYLKEGPWWKQFQ